MSTVDPTDAMIDALVAYLGTTLGSGYTVRAGWPEHGKRLELSEPLIAITAGQPEDELRPPEEISNTESPPGTLISVYAYGRRAVNMQLDIWAPYRATRKTAAAAILSAMNGARFPRVAGLSLELSTYHDVRAEYTIAPGGGTEDDPDGSARGEWRQTIALRAECELADTSTAPKAAEAVIDIEIDDGEDWEISEEFVVTL